jgi:hypothetical protein
MQTRWIDKGVDLEKLGESVTQFFKDRGFETVVDHVQSAYKIVGSMRVGDALRMIQVSVTGVPDDFRVDFASEKESRLSLLAGPLATMFGGGVFVLDRLRRREFYEKLEADFWFFVETIVERPNSA